MDGLRRRARRVGRSVRRMRPDPIPNSVGGARRNIAAHYDLGNGFFETLPRPRRDALLLCAVRERGRLARAGSAKESSSASASSLELGPDKHLLEIGTGWGGLAIHAASRYGCRVTTTTISREQHAYAEARVRRAGLDGLVRVIGQDYRELDGRFDRPGLDRDDRGGRVGVPRSLRPPLLAAACARRADVPAGDLHRRSSLRGGEGRREILEPDDLPRRMPALGGGDRPLPHHADRHAARSGSGISRPPTR